MENKIRLIKSVKVVDGKVYTNLYLKVNDGYPIAIEQKVFKGKSWNPKLQNFLCAVADLAVDSDFARVEKETDF